MLCKANVKHAACFGERISRYFDILLHLLLALAACLLHGFRRVKLKHKVFEDAIEEISFKAV